jgi:hypothetical protein
MTKEIDNKAEDTQILQETAANERVVNHPQFGEVTLVIPTLSLQRQIDAATRAKKKALLNAVDEIPDPKKPGKTIRVPAYKSRNALEVEYARVGWWSEDNTAELDAANSQYLASLTKLELLGFESEEEIFSRVVDIRKGLQTDFENVEEFEEEIQPRIIALTSPALSEDYDNTIDAYLREKAESTRVDDLLEELKDAYMLYRAYLDVVHHYAELIRLQNEHNALFEDSWQNQLQYFGRLVQVFHCTSRKETGEPLWDSLDSMEGEENLDLIRWAFSELTAFWQGLTDEARARAEKYDFIFGPTVSNESTEESPSRPAPKPDGELQENEQISFTEATDTKES